MVKKLPLFNGYTVDLRLKQFRMITGEKLFFFDFNSKKGEKILKEYIQSLNKKSSEFKEILKYF